MSIERDIENWTLEAAISMENLSDECMAQAREAGAAYAYFSEDGVELQLFKTFDEVIAAEVPWVITVG